MTKRKVFKVKAPVTADETTTVYNQSVSTSLYMALVSIAKEDNFDSVQALTRFVLGKYARHKEKKF